MIIRLRSAEFINLSHSAFGDPLPDGGMRVYLRNCQPRDLPPDDAERVRQRLRLIDPEPLPGEPPLPAEARDVSDESVIRDAPPASAPRRRKGAPPDVS
jgi:hypothetical protein